MDKYEDRKVGPVIIKERYENVQSYARNTLSIRELFAVNGVTPQGLTPRIKCVFHSDADPSLFIDFEQNLFHCFSCGRAGSYIQLLYYYKYPDRDTISYPLIAELAEELLKSDKDMQATLGFSTIYLADESRIMVQHLDDGSLKLDLGHRLRPARIDTLTLTHICQHIKNDPEKICDFIADLQNDVPFGVLRSKYYYEEYMPEEDVSALHIEELGDELKAALDDLKE